MKVLLVNGSPHEKGCTYTALTEVCKTLNEEGIDTEIFWIGIKNRVGYPIFYLFYSIEYINH